jgi:Short C-terminal domain
MNMPFSQAMPRSPVFNAVSAGLLLLSVVGLLLTLATPPGPQDMMIPWLRPVGLMQASIGAACVVLIWFRQGWAFYVYVGLVLLGVLLGLVLRYAFPLLLVGPALLAIYLWALHAGGTASMWRQMFGGASASGAGLAYGSAPAMPPPLPAFAPPPPLPVARTTGLDPLEALKRLGALRDSGAITESEFAAKKAELLKRL